MTADTLCRNAAREVFDLGPAAAAAGAPAVGFKALNLARMAAAGLPVPQGFVLGTGFCREYLRRGELAPDTRELLAAGMRRLEAASGLAFGSERRPLLVSVRSGAPVSMPGMMETVLNVGLTEASLRGLLRSTGNPRLVWDSYRRLVQSFAEVVARCEPRAFDHLAERSRELDYRDLNRIARDSLAHFEALTGKPFPQDPMEQLLASVRAVFESWNSAKARTYRRMNGIDDDLGTAVTVQRMVFGNAGGTSGAGVAFTRDPASGENALYMDFLFDAQGEDVVSGRRAVHDPLRLEKILPPAFARLQDARRTLESEFLDAQEIEFTIEDGALYLLQTRAAKRAPWAALRIAVEQVREGLVTPAIALERLAACDVDSIGRTRLSAQDGARLLCRAEPASGGVASGAIALDPATAERMAAEGKDAILVRREISTDDIAGVAAARGLLTALGGRTSHAAVVARQLDKVCLVGCRELTIDLSARRCALGGQSLAEGDLVCLDGDSGDVFAGVPQVVVERPTEYLAEVARWRTG